MKKLLITLILISVAGISYAFAADDIKHSSKFIRHFKNCDYYEETVNTEFEGQSFVTQRKIIGPRNGICIYQEIIKSDNGKYKLDCSFSDFQVEELYKAMKSRSKTPEEFNMDLFSLVTDPKTGEKRYVKTDSTFIKGSKAYVTWSKYQNNPYFCVPTKL